MGLFIRVFCAVLLIAVPIYCNVKGPSHGKVVVCYVGSWAVYRPGRGSFSIEHIDPNVCTHLVYCFAGLNTTDDTIQSLDPWQDLTDDYGKGGYKRAVKLKDSYPHLKVTLAIGGWNEGSEKYSQMSADGARRGRFVRNAVEFIRKYNFDGLDLDWEYPGKRGGQPHDKQNFVLLVKELKMAFSKYNLLLTAALGAGVDTINIAYDVAAISSYLDYIHLMCYDYHGAWDRKTGPNAPFTSLDELNVKYTVEYMLKMGAPAKKLVLGVPLYGRTFLLDAPLLDIPKLGNAAKDTGFPGPYTAEKGMMGYNEICLELNNKTSGFVTYWDEDSQTPFIMNGEKVVSYDDARSIEVKIQYAMKKRLAGAMVWSLDTDDFLGDCFEGSMGEKKHKNFPLMHSINEALAAVVAIDSDIETKSASSSDRLSLTFIVPLIISFTLACKFLSPEL